MNVSAKLAVFMAAFFTLFCLGFAVNGFMALPEITDAAEASASRGYAWVWTGLAAIGIVLGAVSWWIMKDQGKENA